MKPADSVKQMCDEGLVITQTEHDIPITNIDDMLSEVNICSDGNTHVTSSLKSLFDEASQNSLLHAPAQSRPVDCSIVEPEKVDEDIAVLTVETPMKQLNHSERHMYPESDDSDSTSNSSVMISKDRGNLDPSSDEEQVEICVGNVQQPADGPPCSPGPGGFPISSNFSLKHKEKSLTAAQSSQYAQAFKVSSQCHWSNSLQSVSAIKGIKPTSSTDNISIISNPPETHHVSQRPTESLHTSVTSDLLKQSPGSSSSRSETEMSEPMKTHFNLQASSSHPDWSDCPLTGDFKLKVESKVTIKPSSTKLKGLKIRTKTKAQSESFQECSSSESAVPSNSNAVFNQSTKSSPVTSKASNESNMNSCNTLLEVSGKRQVPPERRYLGGSLQTVQLTNENDVHLDWSPAGRSQGQRQQAFTQRTFIEVRLSHGSSSPVMKHNEKHCKQTQRGTDRLTSTLAAATLSSITESISLCHEPPSSTSTSVVAAESSTSRLQAKTTEKRSLSTDAGLSAKYNPFSVRHKINSFENLANFDKPVMKSSDSQSYALTYRASLNQRIAGYMDLVKSTDSQTRQRGFYAESLLPTTSNNKSTSNITLIDNELAHVSSSATPLTEYNPEAAVKKTANGFAPQTPPVLWKKHNKIPSSRLRQLRALSMPDLEKLCTEDFTAVDRAHPFLTKATGPESVQPPAALTMVDGNGATQGGSESTQESPGTCGQQLGWSIRCGSNAVP